MVTLGTGASGYCREVAYVSITKDSTRWLPDSFNVPNDIHEMEECVLMLCDVLPPPPPLPPHSIIQTRQTKSVEM